MLEAADCAATHSALDFDGWDLGGVAGATLAALVFDRFDALVAVLCLSYAHPLPQWTIRHLLLLSLLLLPSRRQPNPHLNCLGPATKRCWKEGIIITATILWQFKSATGQCWREDKLGVYIVGGILKRISSNMSNMFIVVKQPGYGWSYMFESP